MFWKDYIHGVQMSGIRKISFPDFGGQCLRAVVPLLQKFKASFYQLNKDNFNSAGHYEHPAKIMCEFSHKSTH